MDKYINKIDQLIEGDTISLHFEMDTEILFTLTTLRNIHYNYKSTDLSSRMINHYIKEDIILTSDNTAKGRKKFNFFQILWLNIVESLRTMGYSLKNIKKIKEGLFRMPYFDKLDKEHSKYNDLSMFEFIITLSILSNDQIYFIALQDGRYSFVSDRSILIYTMEDTYLQEPHINLPLAHLIKGLFEIIPEDSPYNRLSVDWEKPLYESLSIVEKSLIKEVRSGDWEKISVRLNKGSIDFIEKEQTTKVAQRLTEILQSNEYQDVTIQRRGNRKTIIQKVIDKAN
jgi:hypothetical protein